MLLRSLYQRTDKSCKISSTTQIKANNNFAINRTQRWRTHDSGKESKERMQYIFRIICSVHCDRQQSGSSDTWTSFAKCWLYILEVHSKERTVSSVAVMLKIQNRNDWEEFYINGVSLQKIRWTCIYSMTWQWYGNTWQRNDLARLGKVKTVCLKRVLCLSRPLRTN
jgi:hypothetical protein